jgi:hypothetical protein
VPAFPWLGATPPATPTIRRLTEGALDLVFAPGDTMPVRWWLVQIRDAKNNWTALLRDRADDTLNSSDLPNGFTQPTQIAVSAIGASGVASAPTLLAP